METKQDIGVYTDIEKGYITALIRFSDNISFKVGQYNTDAEPSDYNYYFSLEDEYFEVGELCNIDNYKPFRNVEACRRYALRQMKKFLKDHMFILDLK